jgi:hypothetical protein
LNLSLPSTINVTTTPLTLTLVSNVVFPQNYTSNDGRGAQSISGSTSFTVVIPSNQHSVSFTIQTASDGNVGNNVFTLSGSPLSNYTFITGTLTVVDTDAGGLNGTGSATLTISSGTVSETLSTILNVSLPSTINVINTPLTLTLISNVAFPRNYTSNDGRGSQSISVNVNGVLITLIVLGKLTFNIVDKVSLTVPELIVNVAEPVPFSPPASVSTTVNVPVMKV